MLHFRKVWLAGTMAVIVPMSCAYAATHMSSSDPGFAPETGQINRGFDPKPPSSSTPRKVPTVAEALAAAQEHVSDQPALGTVGNIQTAPAPGAVGDLPNPEQKAANASAAPKSNGTTGVASSAETPGNAVNNAGGTAATTSGPIGAIGATMPAKFSQRNDTLDRVPIMALPLPLNNEQRKSIYQAVMADKTPKATDADHLGPAGVLSSQQYFNDMHPLPANLGGIGAIKSLQYVKANNKVLLVEPSTRVVFDEIDG